MLLFSYVFFPRYLTTLLLTYLSIYSEVQELEESKTRKSYDYATEHNEINKYESLYATLLLNLLEIASKS